MHGLLITSSRGRGRRALSPETELARFKRGETEVDHVTKYNAVKSNEKVVASDLVYFEAGLAFRSVSGLGCCYTPGVGMLIYSHS